MIPELGKKIGHLESRYHIFLSKTHVQRVQLKYHVMPTDHRVLWTMWTRLISEVLDIFSPPKNLW